MALIDNLQNQHIQRIFFMKVNYLDQTGTQQTTFYSDCFCEIPKNLVSGDTLIPEIRLQDIPYFIRELQLMTSEVVVKSEYTLNLVNTDEGLTNFVLNNYFTGQTVELYITTEDNLNPFEANKIFVGTIKEVTIGNNISVKISEVSDLTRMQAYNFEKYNYTYQESSLKDVNKPVLFGRHDYFEAKSIRNFSDKNDFDIGVSGTLRVFQSINGVDLQSESDFYANNRGYWTSSRKSLFSIKFDTNWEFHPGAQYVKPTDIYVKYTITNESDRRIFNTYLTKDTTIVLNSTEYEYVANKLDDSRSYILKQKGGEDLHTEVQQGSYTVFLRKPAIAENTKFLISANKTDTKIQSDIVSVTNISSPVVAVNIVLADDWNFLEAGDLIYLSSSTLSTYFEEFRVNEYFPDTKTIQISLDQYSNRFATGNLKCNFDFVQKIKIGDNNFKRQRTLFTLDPYDGATINASPKNNYAICNVTPFRFVHTSIGIAGNQQSFELIHDATIVSPWTPVVTKTTNSVVVKYSEGSTTAAQIQTALIAATVPFSVTIVGSTAVSPPAIAGKVYFTGGSRTAPFFYFAVHKKNDNDIVTDNTWDASSMYTIGAVPTTNPTLSMMDTRIIRVNELDRLEIIGTETKSQIADKIIAKINTGVMKDYLTAVKIPVFNYVKIKWHLLGNASNRGLLQFNMGDMVTSDNAGLNDTYSQITFRPFITKIENVTDLVLEIDKEGVALSTGAMTSNVAPEFYSKYMGFDTALGPGSSWTTASTLLVPVDPRNTEVTTLASAYWWGNNIINTVDLSTNRTIVEQGNIISLNRSLLYDPVTKLSYFYPRNYNTQAIFVDEQNGNCVYTTKPNRITAGFGESSESNRFTYNVYKNIEMKNVTICYKDQYSHFGTYAKHMLDSFYSIANYNTASINTLISSFKQMQHYSILDKDTEFYKALNATLAGYNLNLFINKNGQIDIQFFNTITVSSDFNINYFDIESRSFSSSEIDYSSFTYCYAYNQKNKVYTEVTTNNIATGKVPGDFKNVNRLTSNAMALSFFDGYRFDDYIINKHNKKDSYVTLVCGLDYIEQIDLTKNFKIIGDPLNLDTVVYKICQIQMNFDKIKIKAKRLN